MPRCTCVYAATVQYDRNGEVCVRFLGVPEKNGTVPKKLVVPFVAGFERFAFRCQRGDFIMGVKLALMRLGGDNALPGAERFFEVPKVYKDPDPTVPIKYVDPYGDETLGQ